MEKETKVAAVSMQNITKTFGSVIANDKVNLDIYKGEILSLLGENGSGKTTLMTIALPSSLIFRRTLNSFSVSCGVSTAVGSSRIRISAPRYSTFTISTVCFWDTDIS